MFIGTLDTCPYCKVLLWENEMEEHIISNDYCNLRREREEEGDYCIENNISEEDNMSDNDLSYNSYNESPFNYVPIWHNLLEMYENEEDEENKLPKPLHPKGEDQIGPEGFTCVVCIINKPQIMGSCSHLCCCFSCSEKIYAEDGPCPVCRKPRNILRHIFTS